MKKIVIFLSVFSVIFTTMKATAAPAPWGIAVNKEAGECAGYWGGDEFTAYGLPEGWIAYYPEYVNGEGDNRITLNDKSCYFINGNAGQCCEELGLKFVSENIGKDGTVIETSLFPTKPQLGGLIDTTPVLIAGVCCCFVLLAAGGTVLALAAKKKY